MVDKTLADKAEALQRSDEFIKSILDIVDEGFIVVDNRFTIVTANAAYCKQVGMPYEEIIGRHCYKISHKSDRPCHEAGEECAVRHSFLTGEPRQVVHKHFDKDDNIIYVEAKSYPLKDAGGRVVYAVEMINNVTEKYLLEDQMLRNQKLEAVGLLAGGIAHDFNNLLQGVFGSITLAKMYCVENGKAYLMLEEAERALNLSIDLARQLMTFSKGGKPVMRPLMLTPLVEFATKFALSGSNVTYNLSSESSELWPVEADECQISQVIQNIVLNAKEAMPGGGAINIRIQNVAAGRRKPGMLKKGNYVMVSFEDMGSGIPKEALSRIFDPYFSTKDKGTGLGLATSYLIVKRHGGLLDVSSLPGKGTTFHLYLPASDCRPRAVSSPEGKGLQTGKGRVLVMDDEEIVRNIMRSMLEALGYTVEVSEDGRQAVEMYRRALQDGAPYQAVILDLTIRAGMGGGETIKRLKEIDPEVRAVVSSGYKEDPLVTDYEQYGFKDVLSKPFELEALSRTMSRLLN